MVTTIRVNQLGQMDVMNLRQDGRRLVLALGGHFSAPGTKHAGVAIVDVTKPRQAKVVGTWRSPKKVKGGAVVATGGGYVYLGAMTEGVMVFDIREPNQIRWLTTFRPDINFPRPNPGKIQHPNARGLALEGNLLFVAYDAGGLRVLNVATPARPVEIGRYINRAMGTKQQAYNNIVVGLGVSGDDVLLTYIKTIVPFQGTWSGIKAVRRGK